MTKEYRFTCSTCGARIVVDRHVRDELLTQGCVVCSSAVRPNCFESI